MYTYIHLTYRLPYIFLHRCCLDFPSNSCRLPFFSLYFHIFSSFTTQVLAHTYTHTPTCMKATNNLHNAATSRFIEFTHDLLALLLLLLIVFIVSKYFPHNIHNNYSYILYVIPLCPTYCLYVVVFSVLRYWL